jgi:hypothetical protein
MSITLHVELTQSIRIAAVHHKYSTSNGIITKRMKHRRGVGALNDQ